MLGFDFDNTLISYDRLFHRVAVDEALIPESVPAQKNAVRDFLREQGREDEWTRLQGAVYGGRILEAEPFPGMRDIIGKLSRNKVLMCIVSHKTRTPYLGEPLDLHLAARNWLAQQGFHDPKGFGWREDQVFFEVTKEAKVSRIAQLGCTHYVDDLPEILEMLPEGVEKILFAPNGIARTSSSWRTMESWEDLPRLLDLQ